MSFKCIKIQKFSGPKDSSLISMYCVRAQGAALLQEKISLRMYFCPPIFWVTVWVEATMQNVCGVPKARLLWIDYVQSHSQGTAARSSSETLWDLKASGGK